MLNRTLEELKCLADQGYANAQHDLGYAYDQGEVLPVNPIAAVKWYRLAAEQMHAVAQASLGIMYAKGRGVPLNYVYAYVWLSLAVK